MFQADPRAYFTQKLIVGGIAAAVFLLCLIAFTLPHVEPDLWGHVQYGRDFLQNGLPSTTTYSFTAEGHRWINHENLSEILFASLVDRWGIGALALFRTLLGLVMVTAVACRAGWAGAATLGDRPLTRDVPRQTLRFSWPVAGAAVAILALALTGYWQIRPQVFSYVFFAMLVLMLSRHGQNLKRDAWLIPVLMWVWTNTHGGFLAGLCVFVAYFLLRSVELVVTYRHEAWPRVWPMIGLIAAGCLATLLNPYGWRLHQWLLESLTIPRPEIVEWHPMRWSSEPFLAFMLLTTMTVVGLVASKRRWDWTHVVLLGVTWWQTVSHQRHFPFFVIMACLWMPVHWRGVVERFLAWRSAKQRTDHSPWLVLWAVATILVALDVSLAVVATRRLGAVLVDKSEYPVEAMQFIADHQLSGRMVVTYNWAQYVIGCFGPVQAGMPTIRVGFDGRFRTCYPLDLIDQHFDFILGNHPLMPRHRDGSSPPPDPKALLERDQPTLVLISRKQPHSTRVMEESAGDWCLLYQDTLAQLWGRRTVHDRADLPAYLAPSLRRITDRAQTGVVSWPALPIPQHRQLDPSPVERVDSASRLLSWSNP